MQLPSVQVDGQTLEEASLAVTGLNLRLSKMERTMICCYQLGLDDQRRAKVRSIAASLGRGFSEMGKICDVV